MTDMIHDRPPFSRPFAVSELRDNRHEIVVTANPSECEALARLNSLAQVAHLEAAFRIAKQGRHGLTVKGELQARVSPICVVSLEPFEIEMREEIDARFEPPPRAGRHASHEEPAFASLAEDDPPDAIIDGKIDLGALAAEYFTLGLDPYPRRPGVEFNPLATGPERESPFADLKRSLETKGNKM